MERVLDPVAPGRLPNLRRRRGPAADAEVPPAAVVPGADAGTWDLYRSGTLPGRQSFPSLEALAGALEAGALFRLELPVDAGLIQRLALPPAEPAELEEMARIQLEKILPYPAESVGMTFQVIETREAEALLAVEAVHHERLVALCQPLTARGNWPSQVTFHALTLASAAPAQGAAALIYREHGRTVLAICENGRLSFAQSLGAHVTPESLAADLPAVLLGAELEGVPVGFGSAALDERCADLVGAFQETIHTPVEIIRAEIDAAEPVDGDLSPAHWQAERSRAARAERLKRRVWIGAAIYLGALVLAFLAVGILKFRVARLDAELAAGEPDKEFIQAAETKWQAIAPATQPRRFAVDLLEQVCDCLPPNDLVQLTAFDLTPNSLSIQGEAPSPSAAVDFTERLKTRGELRAFNFQAAPPTVLPNGRSRFNVSGRINPALAPAS